MEPIFFETPSDFRKWLEKNHDKETEIIVGFYKIGSGKKSITWPEAVDQAICYGWIDSVRRSIDPESYSNRFTPRRKNSIWSNVNIKKVEELTKKGLMKPKGIEAFQAKKPEKSGIYSFEIEAKILDPKFEQLFRKHTKAWEFYENLAPGYRKLTIHRIMSAKQEKTQLARLEKTIAQFENGEKPKF